MNTPKDRPRPLHIVVSWKRFSYSKILYLEHTSSWLLHSFFSVGLLAENANGAFWEERKGQIQLSMSTSEEQLTVTIGRVLGLRSSSHKRPEGAGGFVMQLNCILLQCLPGLNAIGWPFSLPDLLNARLRNWAKTQGSQLLTLAFSHTGLTGLSTQW